MKNVNLEGQTTAPVEHEYVPGYVRDDGKWVDTRYTLHLIPLNGNGSNGANGNGHPRKIRVNFWAGEAVKAKRAFMDDPHVAEIKIIGGELAEYDCRYTGRTRYSVNINIREQFRIIKREPWIDDGLGFEAILDKAYRRQQEEFGDPISPMEIDASYIDHDSL